MAQQIAVTILRGDSRWFDKAESVTGTTRGVTEKGTQIVITSDGKRYTFKNGECVTQFKNPLYRVVIK